MSCLPAPPHTTANPITSKWNRKLVNRRQRASARRSVAHFLTGNMKDMLSSHDASKACSVATRVPGVEECCGDTSATDDMYPDYACFVSYTPLVDKYALLGDDHLVQIKGYGTTVYRLNGKVIKTRNSLHVPALRGLLFSLRRQRQRHGCGILGTYDLGSYVLFLNFVLEIDDARDNLLSFESLGPAYSGPIDYTEPKVKPPDLPSLHPSGRPSQTPDAASPGPHLIEPDLASPSDPVLSPPSTVRPDQDATLPDPTSENQPITLDELATNSAVPLTTAQLSLVHHDAGILPAVPPCYTPAPCESRRQFDSLQLHRIFGCRRFRHMRHLTDAASNATLLSSGELPPTLGAFATIQHPPKGKPLKRHRKYLDKVHMDIIFGDCVAFGGYRYGILLVDVATRYAWFYGITSLAGDEIIGALEQFKADAGGIPRRFHSDFDTKLIGGKTLR